MSKERDGVRLTVRVHPGASRGRLRWDGQTLEAWVTASPIGGAANRAVVTAIAEWLQVPRSAVRLMAGSRSRMKVIGIEGLTTLPPPRNEGPGAPGPS